jgi:hypothetical protein
MDRIRMFQIIGSRIRSYSRDCGNTGLDSTGKFHQSNSGMIEFISSSDTVPFFFQGDYPCHLQNQILY